LREDLLREILEEGNRLREWLWENREKIFQIIDLCSSTLRKGGKLIFFGNGGSAADAQHIVGELVGRFRKERNPLPAIALTTNTSLLTALSNDYSFEEVFSRQLEGLARPGDLAIGISTSGNSPNVVRGLEKAREMGIKTIAFTGRDGGRMKDIADTSLIVPSENTAIIQEIHETVFHIIAWFLEEEG